MAKSAYVRPRITEITSSEIESISPLLMSGGCYRPCSDSCYDSCYSSCYTAPEINGIAYVFLNDQSFPLGHVALGLLSTNRDYEIFNFGTWNNGIGTDGAVSTIYTGEEDYPRSLTDVLIRCRSKTLHLSNERFAEEKPEDGETPYFTEKFNKCMSFTMSEEKIKLIRDYSLSRLSDPGEFNIATRNCLMFVADAFAAAGYLFANVGKVFLSTGLMPPVEWFSKVQYLLGSGSELISRQNLADFY